jgi:hypothetical protein
VSPKKRSGTQSAANSNSRPPEPQRVYLDESLDSESLAAALTEAGISVIRGSRHVPRGTPDDVWLGECGTHGWIVLTRDKRIRYRVLERTALQENGVKAYVFTGGNVSLAATVEIIVGAMPKILKIAGETAAPFIFHIGVDGRPKRMD